MEIEILSESNVEKYLEYLTEAFEDEPDGMVAERVEPEKIRKRVCDPFYRKTKSLLAICHGKVVGQLEYHFYGCIQDGSKMAYVDWVHVKKSHRRQGVATELFNEFEKDCRINCIDQFYLISSDSPAAKAFYGKLRNASEQTSHIIRCRMKI